MISAVTLSSAPHMAPGCVPAASVSIWSRLMSVVSVVSGWAPVSTVLSKMAAVLRPGMVLLTVLVPAMSSRPDSAFICSFVLSLTQPLVHSSFDFLVHSFMHSLIYPLTLSFVDSFLSHSFMFPLVHQFPYFFALFCNKKSPHRVGDV